MNKSEGTDFISKTFSSLSDTIARFYHAGQKRVSISSLKRSKNEKLAALGNKVYMAMRTGKKFNLEDLKNDYASLVELEEAIERGEAELEMLHGSPRPPEPISVVEEYTEPVEKKTRKPRTPKAEKADKPAKKESKKAAAKAGEQRVKRKYTRRKPKDAPAESSPEAQEE